MRPPVFLADPAQLAGDLIVLSGAEGRHATTVRRLAPRGARRRDRRRRHWWPSAR